MQIVDRDQRRFWSKVALPDEQGCMAWLSDQNSKGYGQFRLNGRRIQAHRVSYVLACGAIPDGMVIDHLCRVRHCVAPEHLEAVTPGENTRRGETGAHERVKTHCPKGHAYDGANTYRTPRGKRLCRACRRDIDRARRARNQ